MLRVAADHEHEGLPQRGADGNQRFSSLTIRSSVAAGFRRSRSPLVGMRGALLFACLCLRRKERAGTLEVTTAGADTCHDETHN